MTRTPLLKVTNLHKTFYVPVTKGIWPQRKDLKAVNDISFEVYEGETLGIVGESGCGKSTLGRTVLQLISATSGQVIWMGKDIANMPEDKLRPMRRNLQVIFQDPLGALNPRLTVGQIISEPLLTFEPTLSSEGRRKRVIAMMETVGLLPRMINRYPHEFSGGQAQRIGIARALITKPKMVICDEPVSALDVSIQSQILNLLFDLKKEMGLTLIFISHDLSVVHHISDRVMILYLGRMMELGSKQEIFQKPYHPYTQALLSSIPIPDPQANQNKKTIALEGDLPSPISPPSGCVFRTRCPHAVDACAQTIPDQEDARDGRKIACLRWRELNNIK